MKKELLENNKHHLLFQRNIFAALTILLTANLLLVSCFLFLKRERVIIAPPVVEKAFWVDRTRVSPTYLEQFGCFLGQLLLGKTSQSAPMQRTLLLRHTHPEFVLRLQQKLLEEEKLLHNQNASYTFFPVSVQVDPEKSQVLLEGDRVFYVGGKEISSEREGYTLSFRMKGATLLLSSVTSKGKTHA